MQTIRQDRDLATIRDMNPEPHKYEASLTYYVGVYTYTFTHPRLCFFLNFTKNAY